MAKKRRPSPTPPPSSRRTHSLRILLNDREYKALQDLCREQHITNRSSWVRSVLMSEVLREHGRHAPMLFEEEEMCQS